MTVRRSSRLAGLAALLAAFQAPAALFAGTGHAQAEIVEPIHAIPLAELSFGSIAIGGAGDGSVRVAPDGSQAQFSSAVRSTCDGSASCTPHRAMFAVRGEAGRMYRVIMPTSVTVRGEQTGARLTVDELIMQSRNSPSMHNGGLLDEQGRDRFYVGGTLRVPVRTRPDHFRTNLPILVAYN